jgi:hypothetical protein
MKVSCPGIGEIDQIHLLINVYNSVVVLSQKAGNSSPVLCLSFPGGPSTHLTTTHRTCPVYCTTQRRLQVRQRCIGGRDFRLDFNPESNNMKRWDNAAINQSRRSRWAWNMNGRGSWAAPRPVVHLLEQEVSSLSCMQNARSLQSFRCY